MQEPRVHAPPLEGKQWLNTDRPLAFDKELKGHVVLLDFWTYCCINCIHVLPDLHALEQEFKDEPFAVVGVHSAKFEEENDPVNIRQAILRYKIEHPVVVDDNMTIWRSYGVRSWPTLVLIDPEGYAFGSISGEGHRELLSRAIRGLLDEHREKGTLAEKPMRFKLEAAPDQVLSFPGKVHPFEDKLYVADSTANRVLELNAASGKILRSFGSGEAGLKDGSSEEGQFNDPQGMDVFEGGLYVADRKNHAIRRIDLTSGAIETVIGTGEQVRMIQPGPVAETGLNSPWDLFVDGDKIHIAMAGNHQLWTLLPKQKEIAHLAGNRRENIIDGPALEAQLAQPSGLALLKGKLYFADSEVSAIRYVDLEQEQVGTVVGTGLFDFGDRDGIGEDVLLQHPLGVAVWKDQLLIADTYNNRIKLLDPIRKESKAFLGTGQSELSEEVLTFDEPGGLAVQGNTLYVADTNHHRIVAIDLESKAWRVVVGGAE